MTEQVTATARCAAPPAAVWAVLGDYFRLASWASAIDHSSAMTATPAGPGAVRRVQVGTAVLLEEVTEWDPAATMAYEATGLPPVVRRFENRWTLTEDGGGTGVELVGTIEPGPRPPARAAAKVVARRIAQTNRSLVDDLVAAAEQEIP
ncbi:MAG: SRPBCC family protein [Actinomycetota bacterium]